MIYKYIYINSNRMSKQDYQTMTQKELRNYVLAHREDKEAFHAYVDK